MMHPMQQEDGNTIVHVVGDRELRESICYHYYYEEINQEAKEIPLKGDEQPMKRPSCRRATDEEVSMVWTPKPDRARPSQLRSLKMEEKCTLTSKMSTVLSRVHPITCRASHY